MTVQYALFTFNLPLPKHKLPAFRSAMIDWAGRENTLLHNHLQPTPQPNLPRGGFVYRYPLVQYRIHQGNAAIFALQQGADDLQTLFANRKWEITLAGKNTPLRLALLQSRNFTLAHTPQPYNYHLQNWVALNQQNYRQYTQQNSLIERLQMLQQILTANILSFAKGVGWHIPGHFNLAIQQLNTPPLQQYHKTHLSVFDVQFSCSLALPPYIGLGKAVSHGFGVLAQHQ